MRSIYILLLIVSSTLSAQVPGYLGKRLSASVGIMAGNPYPINDPVLDRYRVKSDITGQLRFDYVITQNMSLGLDLDSKKSNVSVGFGSLPYQVQVNDDRINLLNKAIGISYKKFLKGQIAPYGTYRKMGLGYNFSKTQDPKGVYAANHAIFHERKANFLDFRYGFGVNKIYFDKLIVNYYWESIITKSLWDMLLNRQALSDKEVFRSQLQIGSFLNFGLTFGYLIY